MALNEYVTLGRSGLRVSPFCLGAMTFGMDWGWGSEPKDACAIMDKYIEHGGNFIDTANVYTKGHSEKIIGDHIGKHPAKRDRVVIATKFMSNLFVGDPNGGGAGRKGVINQVEHSLRRLQTDYIDLLWAHFRDPHTPMDEMLRAMDDLVRQGKVRYLGLSDHPAWVCTQAHYLCRIHNFSPIIALQIEYSLLERTVEAELMPMARELGMGVTPWSPLKGGVLTGKHRKGLASEGRAKSGWLSEEDAHTTKVLDAVEAVAKETGVSAAQVALAWVQSRAGVASSIIGARTMEHLEDNIKALDVKLTDAQIATLDEASDVPLAFPALFLTYVLSNIHGGTTINGDPREPSDLLPKGDDDRW